jgi:Cdc6-like AAA superfamily ATPase
MLAAEVQPQPLSAAGDLSRPWVERYRPKDLQSVAHQNEVVATLQNAVETGRLPHLLLYGPPGSGKVRRRRRKTWTEFPTASSERIVQHLLDFAKLYDLLSKLYLPFTVSTDISGVGIVSSIVAS